MSGAPDGGGGNATGPLDDAGEPARAVEILETRRSMRQLVTFCPDDLPEAFANHFSRGQVLEMMARLEEAREADQPPANAVPFLLRATALPVLLPCPALCPALPFPALPCPALPSCPAVAPPALPYSWRSSRRTYRGR